MEDFKAAKAIAPVEFDNVMKAVDRQRQQKRYEKKVFKEQIKKPNNDNGFFVKEKR